MHTVQNSHLLLLYFLDLAGADLSCRDKDNHSLLHWSVYRDDMKTMIYLLNRGASPNDIDANNGEKKAKQKKKKNDEWFIIFVKQLPCTGHRFEGIST
jgi:ankyrin repeat protein